MQTIYDEGVSAYAKGAHENDNPYPARSSQWHEWKRGWDDAWCDDDSGH